MSNRDKTRQFGRSVSKLRLLSFACQFSFCNASRFICSFICEYFLNKYCRNVQDDEDGYSEDRVRGRGCRGEDIGWAHLCVL